MREAMGGLCGFVNHGLNFGFCFVLRKPLKGFKERKYLNINRILWLLC